MWTSVLPAFLCLHSWSCLLLCFLKAALTPVMLAAGKGHTDVVDMLVHKYNCSLTEIDKVSAFVLSVTCRCEVSQVHMSVST